MQRLARIIFYLAIFTVLLKAGDARASSISKSPHLIIDTFDEPSSQPQNVIIYNSGAQINIPGVGTFPLVSVPSSQSNLFNSILGGYRDLFLRTIQFPIGSNTSTSKAEVLNNYLAFSNDTDVQSILNVNWDGNDNPKTINPIGLRNSRSSGIDLTLAGILDGISVEILSADRQLEISLDVYTDANNYSRATRKFANGVESNLPINSFFDFKRDFNTIAGAGVDFANVGAIAMTLSGPKELDAKITFMEAIRDPARRFDVPESTVSLFSLLGTAVLAAFYKKGESSK
jgi:hypothetical protein